MTPCHCGFSTMWHILSCLNISVAYLNHFLLFSFYRRTCIIICLVYLSLLQEISPAVFKIHSSSIYKRALIFKEKEIKILFECSEDINICLCCSAELLPVHVKPPCSFKKKKIVAILPAESAHPRRNNPNSLPPCVLSAELLCWVCQLHSENPLETARMHVPFHGHRLEPMGFWDVIYFSGVTILQNVLLLVTG